MSKTFNKSLKKKKYKFKNGVYNFLNNKPHYSDTFNLEYEKFSKIQYDSFNKLDITNNRFYACSRWSKNEIKNKNLLEVGSGGGRFTEIILKSKSNLYTFDSSNAIYTNYKNNKKKILNKKSYFIKADIIDLPFKKKFFDYIFCYGVIQNTKNPLNIINVLINFLNSNGKLSCDVTKGNNYNLHLLNPKYFWRILSTKIDERKLFNIVNFYVNKFYGIDTFLKKNLGVFGKFISRIIFPLPLINYHYLNLKKQLKINWSILDTFDCLASKYDNPLNKIIIQKYLKNLKKNNKSIKKAYFFETNNTFVINIEK